MMWVVILILLILALGGGAHWGTPIGWSPVGIILIILIILLLTGNIP